MESTLPPLFDHMDNVDISSPNDDIDIFKSAIQVHILEKKKLFLTFFYCYYSLCLSFVF